MKRVVVTGIGVVASNGLGKTEFTNALINGKSRIKHIAELEELEFGCQIGGIPDISKSIFNSYIELYGMQTASLMIQYAVIAGLEAWLDAKLPIPLHDSKEVDYNSGAIIGSGMGTIDVYGNRVIPLTNNKNIKRLRSTIVENCMISGGSASLSSILAIGNQLTSNSSACNSGAEAILMAYERIKYGKATRMLAGSSEAYSVWSWSQFDALRVTTRKHNNEPEKGSRPMSESASGFVPSAGAGIIILEELQSALKRNAPVYAELIGGYINSGGQRNGGSMTAPSTEGVIKCIKGALYETNTKPKEINFISGHLSSTMADTLEIENWSKALELTGNNFPIINSTKSLIGHSLGAAGSIECIAAILQLHHQFIHPSVNCEDIHPQIEKIVNKNCIPQHTIQNISLNCIVKASFGFGDVNTCLIFKKLNK
ncbi:MAG: beta-ketoacyl-ACP synthase [Bacteroidetes bacterium GWA2_32_17]|nr:MAG: beta-ketoacyl-ACP synthase [Bacteroidetes bacterium GWA2_32_17]